MVSWKRKDGEGKSDRKKTKVREIITVSITYDKNRLKLLPLCLSLELIKCSMFSLNINLNPKKSAYRICGMSEKCLHVKTILVIR